MANKPNKPKKSSPRYVWTGHEKFPEINIKLTHQESKILFQQPPELFKLYMFLSLYRDFDTGITGEKVHIDDTSFKVWVGYPSKQGRKGNKPSTTHIVRWLEQLEELGLIQACGNNVFYLPLATTNQHDQKLSHQTVTKPSPKSEESVTKSEVSENPINTDYAAELKTEVSPNNDGSVTEVSQRLYTIPVNNLTKLNYIAQTDFLSAEENKFLNLFTDLKLSLNPAGDLKAITTAKALIQAGVTLEVASEALKIKLAAYTGTRTPHPSYFKDAIINYKRDLEAIKQQPQETNHARQSAQRDRLSKQSPQRVSKTQQFYDSCFAGLARNKNRE